VREAEAGEAPSSAFPPGVGSSQGGLAQLSEWLGVNASSSSRRGSPRREPRAQESNDLRVLVSNVGCKGR
jgi:hypothetical protein